MATGGQHQGHSYPKVKEPADGSRPYYMKGDEKCLMNYERTPLLYSCQKMQTNLTLYQLCKQINDGGDVNSNEGGWSPLDVAYFKKNYLTMRVLLANGASVCNITSPLHLAIASGCVNEVERYLSKAFGFDVSQMPSLVGDGNYTAPSLDVEGEDEEFVVDESSLDACLEKDTAMEVQKVVHYKFRYTPEMKVKAEANVELLLFDMNNFDVDLEDCRCDTPLHIAAHTGNTSLAELLIKCGANVNLFNKKGYPPLLYACKNSETLGLLIKVGAKVQQFYRGDDGVLRGPILHAVVGMQASYKGVKELLEHGIDVHTLDTGGKTALHLAARGGDVDCIRVLLEHGADINAVEPLTGRTPLYLACNGHHHDAARYLIEQGSNMEAKDRLSECPIVTVLENMEYLKNANPFFVYFGRSVYTVPRLVHTLQELLNHGCRLVFLFNVDLMVRVYRRTKDIFRYLMSSGSGIRGVPLKINRKILMEFISETDSDTIMVLRSCGYDLQTSAAMTEMTTLNTLNEPLSLMSTCRLTIRKLVHAKMTSLEPQSRLKNFFKKLSLKQDIPKAIPSRAFDPLPLPGALKMFLCFQDLIDLAIKKDVSYVDSVIAKSKGTTAKGDAEKLENMLVDEAMQELGVESGHLFKSYHEAQKKLLKTL